jgi:superfamily II DNA or RNA helicase
MITLNSHQQSAANMLALSLAHGGKQRFIAPTGSGRTLILGEALRIFGQPTAFISRIDILRDQTVEIFGRVGVTNVKFYLARRLRDIHAFDGSQFALIVLSEELRDIEIDHPNVLRYGI